MAVINFLFGNRTPSGFSLSGVVEFEADLTVEEGHERSSDITEHPVEIGARITDHVILNPERLRLEGFVTDAGSAVFASDPGRTKQAFDTLEAAWESREPLQVVTGYKTYSDMVIVRMDLPRSRPSSMRFSMELVNIRRVESATAAITAAEPGEAGTTDSPQTSDLSQGEVDVGRQSTREASDTTAERSTSALRALGDSIRERIGQ